MVIVLYGIDVVAHFGRVAEGNAVVNKSPFTFQLDDLSPEGWEGLRQQILQAQAQLQAALDLKLAQERVKELAETGAGE